MTDFELLIMKELSEIKSAAISASAAAQAAVTASGALEIRLLDSTTGVIPTIQASIIEVKANIAEDKKGEKIKDYIHYASAPVLVTLQSILRHMGVHV